MSVAMLVTPRRQIPATCFTGDRAARADAWRTFEKNCWADAVEHRGLRLRALDPVDRIIVEAELDRRLRRSS